MAKITVSAKEIVADVKAEMDDTALMEKYQLSDEGLQSVFKKLIDAGVLKQEELEKRQSEPDKANEYVWECSQCGKPQPKPFDQCPECGDVGSRIKTPLTSEQAEGIKSSETQGEHHQTPAQGELDDTLRRKILEEEKAKYIKEKEARLLRRKQEENEDLSRREGEGERCDRIKNRIPTIVVAEFKMTELSA